MGDSPAKEREVWSSRIAFYFAAIGSAVGFGNVWRFPSLSYSYGGGAFFVPYLMALFLIGIPLLVLEIGFGQFFQTGDVGVFGGFHPRMRGVGVSSVACGFMLVTYYSMLIAWVFNAFFQSFASDSIWYEANDPGKNLTEFATEARKHFNEDVIGMGTTDGLNATRLVGENVGYSFLVWVIVFFCIAFGIKWTGRIAYVTMGLPIILLFIFLGRAVSLEGASDGIYECIGQWDLSVLSKQGDVWSTAVTQIFFSIGVTFGIMTAYGSYCKRTEEPAFMNSCVIALSNSLFSFIAGFAVFAAIGHLSHLADVDVGSIKFTSFDLVFGTWPVVLATLPGGIHWVRLLFFNLILLGIDSAFSFAEAVVTVAQDTSQFQNTAKWKITLVWCLLGWLFSFLYATDAGLYFLDVIDYYINFVMLLVGFFETFAAGWVYAIGEQIETCGLAAVFFYFFAQFGSIIVASGIWFGVPAKNGGIWGGFVALVLFFLVFFTVSLFFLRKKMDSSKTFKELLWALTFKNVFELRNCIQPTIKYIPSLWCLLIKQFIPHVLIILFVNLATTQGKGFNYSGYPAQPYQILGIMTFVFAIFLFSVGIAFPPIYSCLALPESHASYQFLADGTHDDEKGIDKDGEVEKSVDDNAAEAEEAPDGGSGNVDVDM